MVGIEINCFSHEQTRNNTKKNIFGSIFNFLKYSVYNPKNFVFSLCQFVANHSNPMKTKIRRRIITETKQIAAILDSASPVMLSCEICGDSCKMVTPLFAAKLRKISTREIYQSIESGTTHFIELADKQIFVCLKTL